MRRGLFMIVLLALMVLLIAGCSTKKESGPTVPKGFGVLTVLVEDDGGKPLDGAQVTIANSMAQQFTTKTGRDGRTKGAGQLSLGPFSVLAAKEGYASQQKEGIELSESLPTAVSFQLKHAGP
jgi:hypothetical protein